MFFQNLPLMLKFGKFFKNMLITNIKGFTNNSKISLITFDPINIENNS